MEVHSYFYGNEIGVFVKPATFCVCVLVCVYFIIFIKPE